jgi:hypothetical protein
MKKGTKNKLEELFNWVQQKTLEKQEIESQVRVISDQNKTLLEKIHKSREWIQMTKNKSEAASLARKKGKIQAEIDTKILKRKS